MSDAREYTTEDLALVAWLLCHRITPSTLSLVGNNRCRWHFNLDPFGLDKVIEYDNDLAQVNPRVFARKLAAVRIEMYRFLNVPPRPVRR